MLVYLCIYKAIKAERADISRSCSYSAERSRLKGFKQQSINKNVRHKQDNKRCFLKLLLKSTFFLWLSSQHETPVSFLVFYCLNVIIDY